MDISIPQVSFVRILYMATSNYNDNVLVLCAIYLVCVLYVRMCAIIKTEFGALFLFKLLLCAILTEVVLLVLSVVLQHNWGLVQKIVKTDKDIKVEIFGKESD